VRAEKEYRENYQKLGLPLREELEKQRELSHKELAFSERLN